MTSRTAEIIAAVAFAINLWNAGLYPTEASPYILATMVAVAAFWRVFVAWANLQTFAEAGAWFVGRTVQQAYKTRPIFYLQLVLDTWLMIAVMFMFAGAIVPWLFWPCVAATAVTAMPIGYMIFGYELYVRTVGKAQAEIDAEK
jgi:hypothetical protein